MRVHWALNLLWKLQNICFGWQWTFITYLVEYCVFYQFLPVRWKPVHLFKKIQAMMTSFCIILTCGTEPVCGTSYSILAVKGITQTLLKCLWHHRLWQTSSFCSLELIKLHRYRWASAGILPPTLVKISSILRDIDRFIWCVNSLASALQVQCRNNFIYISFKDPLKTMKWNSDWNFFSNIF